VQAKTQLDTARVQDTDIGVMRAQYEHAIAILIGKPPAEFTLAPAPLSLEPPAIPVGVPSQLLERRPDIAASERRVAEANEGIGIARAAYFPSLVLSAAGGLEGRLSALIVLDAPDQNIHLASRNHPRLETTTGDLVNAEQLLRYDKIFITDGALGKLSTRLQK